MRNRKSTKEIWDYWSEFILNEDGSVNIDKLKNELSDLDFIADQIGTVYCEITGGMLSKPFYYAETIISEYHKQLEEAYENGYQDCKEEYEEKEKHNRRPGL